MKKAGIKKRGPRIGISWWFTLIVMAELLVALGIAQLITSVLKEGFGLDLVLPTAVWLIFFSVVIGGAFSIFLNMMFFTPIKKISASMKKVAEGDFSIRLNRKNSMREVQEIYSNFNLMTRELEATEILKTDFVSSVSHEIKTPVTAIEGYAMLLQDSQCTEEEREQYVEKILFNTKRLSELVGNILLLSKIENQAIRSKTVRFRLDEQIRQAIMLLEPKWTEKETEFDVDMDCVEFTGDDSFLLHVWTNLIGNAVKFSPRGGEVLIHLREKDDRIAFVIEDEGAGITEEAQKHIFDKFYQADSSHKQEGNGLGLALVKRIVDAYDGEIFVQNLEEKGCRFTVELPKL